MMADTVRGIIADGFDGMGRGARMGKPQARDIRSPPFTTFKDGGRGKKANPGYRVPTGRRRRKNVRTGREGRNKRKTPKRIDRQKTPAKRTSLKKKGTEPSKADYIGYIFRERGQRTRLLRKPGR